MRVALHNASLVAFGIFLLLLQTALFVVADIDSMTIKGSHFFYQANGSQFFIRGVAYQVQGRYTGILASVIDPLADACMQQFADDGIYVVLDLAGNDLVINRTAPAWSTDLYARYNSVIDNMQQYNNTLGFVAGDQVSSDTDSTAVAGFGRAAVRDMKTYMAQQDYRTESISRSIGIGITTNDDASIREDLAAYLNCGNQGSAIDFYG
ncbi:hypothetical protein LTS18_003890 [Coniosporium uncinatum]|uniref:Uncharacterized protein n=1 Tax=Coniosporium uncinatum TaxID=93489 RepID=A0ACC3DT30_9PEZI|nr:hypothetical protein LTS18_003890 [Coniosporium uncinatum]